jgi:acyl-coenzyme A thioesterase PaaI-like protein
VLSRAVPFNAPHHFQVLNVKAGETEILLPYRRSNLNHVKGIHACALATLCEYTIGMTLIGMISENKFRIILKNIRMEYHYQAKMDVTASFKITDDVLKEVITGPLEKADAVFHEFEIKVTDTDKNHICTGFVNWQVKKWEKVGK